MEVHNGEHECDVLIVGGGMVGASLALALDQSGLRVALVEAVAAKANQQPSYDERNLALARATVNALDALGVWSLISARATPIRHVHVSRRGEFGVVRLDAAVHDFDAFGAVLPARELGNGLLARLESCRALIRYAPAQLTGFAIANDAIRAQIATDAGEYSVRTRLLVGADGTASCVRSTLGIRVETYNYAQTGFVTTVTPERALDGCAYERFTDSGPVALLPLTEHRAGVVLTVPSADAAQVAALDDHGFLKLLHQRFGYRLGRLLRPGRRVSYPLSRVQADRLVGPRAVLVGNAAQTLHPIAAQGFNLGMRDALMLAELLIVATRDGTDPGDPALLARYAECRRKDREGTLAFSDGLARLTTSEILPLKLLRTFGLLALDRLSPLQRILIRRGMGFRGTAPRLALGER